MSSKEEMISVFQRVANEVAERQLPALQGSTVIADLGIDSLQTLEIVAAMEREFQVQIPDDQLVGINTVDDLVALIHKRKNPLG